MHLEPAHRPSRDSIHLGGNFSQSFTNLSPGQAKYHSQKSTVCQLPRLDTIKIIAKLENVCTFSSIKLAILNSGRRKYSLAVMNLFTDLEVRGRASSLLYYHSKN